jgi:cytochrome c-type biogenesis protein CcmF
MTGLGDLAVLVLVASAGGSVVASVLGFARRDERARRAGLWLLAGSAAAAVAAVAVLGWALLRSDFTVAYVVAESRSRGATWYRLAGLWGGMAGSLLVWTAMLAGVAVAATTAIARKHAPGGTRLGAMAQVVTGSVVCGFGLLVATLADPFVTLPAAAVEGRGLTPILEHPAMLYHPPLLYLGLASLLAPFALTVATAAAGRLDDRWLDRCRRWALVSWALLGIGMIAGAHWAYVEVGWGGFWAWDPVENTALLPWLAVTAFVHAALLRARMVAAILVVVAFAVALLGTLLTRSGATQSVHAFAEDAAIGWALLVLVALAAAGGAAALVAARRVVATKPDPSPRPDRARDRARDRALGTQVVTTLLALAVVFAGTVYPVVRSLTGAGGVAAVDGGFFSLFVGPLALVVLVLAGVGPRLGRSGSLALAGPVAGGLAAVAVALVAGWRSPFGLAVAALGGFTVVASAVDLARYRRGGHLAHLGLAVLLAGIAGSSTGASISATVAAGGRMTVGEFEIVNDGARVVSAPDAAVQRVAAPVTVEHDGRVVARLVPEIRVDRGRGDQLAETALWSTPRTDVLVALRDAGDGGEALLQIYVRPLVVWVWWGALLMVAGGVWAWSRLRVPAELQRRPAEMAEV